MTNATRNAGEVTSSVNQAVEEVKAIKNNGMIATHREVVVYNNFSLDSILAAELLARTNPDIIIRPVTDNGRFNINEDSKCTLIGITPDQFKDFVGRRRKALQSFHIQGEVEPDSEAMLQFEAWSGMSAGSEPTEFSKIQCPITGNQERDEQNNSRKLKLNFELLQFEAGAADMSFEQLADLWAYYVNATKPKWSRPKCSDSLTFNTASAAYFNEKFAGYHSRTFTPSQPKMSDFSLFIRKLKVRLSSNYRMVGVRIGKDVKYACLTSLSPEDWIWAKRIVKSSHARYINMSRIGGSNFVSTNLDAKALRDNDLEYAIVV